MKPQQNVKLLTKFCTTVKRSSTLTREDMTEVYADLPPEVMAKINAKMDAIEAKRKEAKDNKAKDKQKKARANDQVTGQNKGNNFHLWLMSLMKGVDDYVRRCGESGDKGPRLLAVDLKDMAPWDYEKVLEKELAVINVEGMDNIEKIVKEHAERYKLLSVAVTNLKIRAFIHKMEVAAFVAALYKRLVDGGKMTGKELSEKLLQDNVSTLRRYRTVYKLVCDYNLILYSGASFSHLAQWNTNLRKHLMNNPADAYKLTGGDVKWPKLMPLKGPELERKFLLDDKVYNYSEENVVERKAAATRIADAMEASESRAGSPMDDIAPEVEKDDNESTD
jgi:hypothetical protein